jgi:hypothetical protein
MGEKKVMTVMTTFDRHDSAFSIDDGEFPGAPGRPWVALPRTRRNLDPLSLLGRGSRVPSRRKCRFLKTPGNRYRSVLAREDASAQSRAE